MRVCLIYGVPDILCVVLSYKSEYFCLCQKTIVTWYRFLFSFPIRCSLCSRSLFVDFLSLFNKVFASLRALFIEQEDIFCEGSSSAPGMIIKTADIKLRYILSIHLRDFFRIILLHHCIAHFPVCFRGALCPKMSAATPPLPKSVVLARGTASTVTLLSVRTPEFLLCSFYDLARSESLL